MDKRSYEGKGGGKDDGSMYVYSVVPSHTRPEGYALRSCIDFLLIPF